MHIINKVNVDITKLKNISNYKENQAENISLTKIQSINDNAETINFERSENPEVIHIDSESSKVKNLPETIDVSQNNDGTQTIREVHDWGTRVITCDVNGNVINAGDLVIM